MKLGTHDLFKSGTHDLINKLGMFLAPKLAIAREISRVSPILLVLTGCVTYEFSEEENASALSMSVKGGLSAEEVEPVIEAYYDQMQSCKDKVPPKDAKGVVTVEFDIGHRGKVVATEIKNSTVASEELEKCVRAQLRKWQFPEPREDGQATVTYPFQFD